MTAPQDSPIRETSDGGLRPPDSIRVAVVDDDTEMTRTLKTILVDLNGFQWAGAWTRPIEFLGALPHLHTDIILLDIDMPRVSGIDCIPEIKEFAPSIPIMMLTVVDDDDKIFAAILNGANAYLLKGASPATLCSSIQQTVAGGSPMTPSIARRIVDYLRNANPAPAAKSLETADEEIEARLTAKQAEALRFLATGLTYQEIADQMGIAQDTVRKHVRQIYERLGVRNRTQAAILWHQKNKPGD